jgi:hypothetical protein
MKTPYLLLLFLAGCAVTSGPKDLTFLQRDTNKTYFAAWQDEGGLIKLELNGKNYSGRPVKVDEANLFGFKSRYGNMKSAGTLSGFLLSHYKVILTNEDNLGIRCDITTDYNGGSGICLDETSRVYDMVISKSASKTSSN